MDVFGQKPDEKEVLVVPDKIAPNDWLLGTGPKMNEMAKAGLNHLAQHHPHYSGPTTVWILLVKWRHPAAGIVNVAALAFASQKSVRNDNK